MNYQDFPSLYQSADKASNATQKYYTTAIKFYLILLIIGALLTQYAPKNLFWSIAVAFTLICTLSLAVYQALKRYDKVWYNGRAVAESVKTRSWRFIMKAEPYDNFNLSYHDERKFISDIKEILRENIELGNYLDHDCATNCITDRMQEIRSMDVELRKNYYRLHRIDEQRKWYSDKAKWNNRRAILWFIIMITANALAIFFVLLQIGYFSSQGFPVEPFIVIAGSALTWMQVKKFQDLSTSYNLTAHEIAIIRDDSNFITNEAELSDFVRDSENAFSREHTQWFARTNK